MSLAAAKKTLACVTALTYLAVSQPAAAKAVYVTESHIPNCVCEEKTSSETTIGGGDGDTLGEKFQAFVSTPTGKFIAAAVTTAVLTGIALTIREASGGNGGGSVDSGSAPVEEEIINTGDFIEISNPDLL